MWYVMNVMRMSVEAVEKRPIVPITAMPCRISRGRGSLEVCQLPSGRIRVSFLVDVVLDGMLAFMRSTMIIVTVIRCPVVKSNQFVGTVGKDKIEDRVLAVIISSVSMHFARVPK